MPINSKLVRVSRLVDAVDGRPDGAWVIQYHGQTFVTDIGGGNPEPFAWHDQPHEPIDEFAVITQEELAGALRVNPALLGFIRQGDKGFPQPILSFREGPIWDAAAIDAWLPTREPLDARDRSVPRA
ncbi:MAG: hypothetical protein ABI562_08800 [Chloroflexota bacterium]